MIAFVEDVVFLNKTDQHILFECDYAKRLWRASGVLNLVNNGDTTTLEEKLETCLDCVVTQ